MGQSEGRSRDATAELTDFHFLGDAEAEIAEALDWYRERSMNAADRLLDELNRTIERIRDWLQAAPVFAKTSSGREIRRARIAHFPYGVIYAQFGVGVVVVALPNLKRRPLYWAERLGQLR